MDDNRADALSLALIGHIVYLLDARTLARCACINKTWRAAAEEDYLWAGHCKRLWGSPGDRLAMVPPAIRSLPLLKQAYARSLIDARRTEITSEELCRFAWRFKLRGRQFVEGPASPYTAMLNNYWSSSSDMYRFYHADGAVTASGVLDWTGFGQDLHAR